MAIMWTFSVFANHLLQSQPIGHCTISQWKKQQLNNTHLLCKAIYWMSLSTTDLSEHPSSSGASNSLWGGNLGAMQVDIKGYVQATRNFVPYTGGIWVCFQQLRSMQRGRNVTTKFKNFPDHNIMLKKAKVLTWTNCKTNDKHSHLSSCQPLDDLDKF